MMSAQDSVLSSRTTLLVIFGPRTLVSMILRSLNASCRRASVASSQYAKRSIQASWAINLRWSSRGSFLSPALVRSKSPQHPQHPFHQWEKYITTALSVRPQRCCPERCESQSRMIPRKGNGYPPCVLHSFKERRCVKLRFTRSTQQSKQEWYPTIYDQHDSRTTSERARFHASAPNHGVELKPT